jgi:hypothetical protein
MTFNVSVEALDDLYHFFLIPIALFIALPMILSPTDLAREII